MNEPARECADRELWGLMRQALLARVDAIERRLGISPTTAELRREHKEQDRRRAA